MGNNDSRAHFRNNIGGLFENDLTGHDASYWLEMIRIPYTLDDIFLAVNSVMIRDLLSKHPENIGELLKVCAETIQKASRGDLTIDRDILLNSVKVVTRFMPVLAENIDIRKVL